MQNIATSLFHFLFRQTRNFRIATSLDLVTWNLAVNSSLSIDNSPECSYFGSFPTYGRFVKFIVDSFSGLSGGLQAFMPESKLALAEFLSRVISGQTPFG